MTNTTKAILISVLNGALGVAVAFGVPLTGTQAGAILAFGNAVGALIVAVTYKQSRKRLPDEA